MADKFLSGRVAMVTGAGSPIGLGFVISRALASAGAQVVMLDRNEEWLAQSVATIREAAGADAAMGIRADVSDAHSVQAAVERTISELGRLHIVVNNAGTTPLLEARGDASLGVQTNIWDLSPQVWDRVISVNLNGAFYVIQAALPHLLEQKWGRVIGVTTSLDTMYRKGLAPYGPSKAAHEAMVAILASELEGSGITANILVPGGIASTNMIPAAMTRNSSRLISPGVMAAPALWLMSEEASGFTNQRIIAHLWDEALPLEQRLARAAAPAAWRGLGSQALTAGLLS